MKHNAGVSDQAQCAVSVRCAHRIVVMSNLNGRGVNNQQCADDPEQKTSGVPRAGWRLPGHDVWLKPKSGTDRQRLSPGNTDAVIPYHMGDFITCPENCPRAYDAESSCEEILQLVANQGSLKGLMAERKTGIFAAKWWDSPEGINPPNCRRPVNLRPTQAYLLASTSAERRQAILRSSSLSATHTSGLATKSDVRMLL